MPFTPLKNKHESPIKNATYRKNSNKSSNNNSGVYKFDREPSYYSNIINMAKK